MFVKHTNVFCVYTFLNHAIVRGLAALRLVSPFHEIHDTVSVFGPAVLVEVHVRELSGLLGDLCRVLPPKKF